MKVRDVLGVDFRGDRLMAVQVRQEDAGFGGAARGRPRRVLTHWASQATPAGAESAALAAALRQMLDDGGFTATAAALGLPRGRGFLRVRAAGEEGLTAFSQTDYVIDGWRTDDGREVVGVASRPDVSRVVEIAHQAGLTPVAVELRGLGCATALGLLGTGEGATLGVIVGASDVTAALVEGQALLAVQSRLLRPAGDRLDRWNAVLASVEQALRLVKMAHPAAAPAAVRVIVNPADQQAARNLPERLGLPVELAEAGAGANLHVEGKELDEPAEYAAAIGLALEALQEGAAAGGRGRGPRPAGRLNFLQARQEPRRKRALSRRHAVAAAVAAAVIALAAAGAYAVHRRSGLSRLQQQYDQVSQDLRLRRQAQRRRQAVGPWLSTADGGRRISQRGLYDAVTELLGSDAAYVQRLEVAGEQDGAPDRVVIKGRARRRQAVHDIVSRLNRSPMFDAASLGAVVDDADDAAFPTRFSVNFRLRQRR